MRRAFTSLWFTLSLASLSCLIPLTTKAQISPDGTTSSTVNQDGNNFTIEQGDRVGDNLFHSFNEFSVPTLGSAAFNNATNIANIFSRVTGSNISSIDGLISANGAANLFLINPNGIIFGENASLNLGGSFFASTADSLLFEGNTEFSATNPQAPPLLEVSIPIGLSFRDNPGEIVNRSFVQNNAGDFVGLEVASGENLTLVGGNINFEEGEATARGGNIELGGLSEAGTVGISEDDSLSFPEDVAKADITLGNAADVDVRSTGGGSIIINARDLNLTVGEFGSSLIRAGITSDSTFTEAQAGNIIIDVAENITLNDSRITNQVDSGGVGNSGNIIITTGSLEVINGGDVDASTFGQGNAGSVEITARDTITFDGEDLEGIPSGATSLVDSQAEGNAGGVTIDTGSLSLTNGGRVIADTFGQGNAGSVDITARDTITFDGESSQGSNSGATSVVNSGAVGDAGGVTINTGSLSLTNGADIDASTVGQGNAGSVEITAGDTVTFDGENSDGFVSSATSQVAPGAVGDAGGVTITTGSLTLTNGGQVDASTFAEGNAGSVSINADDTVTFDGESSQGFVSSAGSQVAPGAVGDAGGVTITTGSLTLTNGGQVDASTFAEGNAGSVSINAGDTVTFDGESSQGSNSGAGSTVQSGAVGNAGGVTINTGSLSLTNGGRVIASTFGQGNAGSVEINARDTITFDGEDSQGFASSATSLVNPEAVGNAGGVTITTGSLSLTNGGQVDASTAGEGNAGSVEISARDTITFDGENSGGFVSGAGSQVAPGAEGDAGGVTITTGSLSLTNGGQVDASTFGEGDAGSVQITASDNITIDGEDSDGIPSGATSRVNSGAMGDAGGVTITTGSLSLTNGGRVDASTFGEGDAGSVEITASDTITIDGENSDGFVSSATSQVAPGAKGNAGGVTITTSSLSLTNGGRVATSTFGQGNAGDVNVNARESIFISGVTDFFRSGISADALISSGNGGNVNVFTHQLTIDNGGTIEASNFDSLGIFNPGTGEPGNINIEANSLSLNNQASIEAATQSETGEGANINLTIGEDIIFRNNSLVSARAFENANGGNVTINANDGLIIAFPNQNNDIRTYALTEE